MQCIQFNHYLLLYVNKNRFDLIAYTVIVYKEFNTKTSQIIKTYSSITTYNLILKDRIRFAAECCIMCETIV